MRKVLVLLSGLLLISGMLLAGTACVTDEQTTGTTEGIATWEHKGTLQGKIMDAITGAAIGGNDLKVYLLQGDDERKPNELHRGEDDIFKGEYVFNGVPIALNDTSGELVFKLVVINPGYQTYTDYIELSAQLVSGASQGNEQINNTFANEAFNFQKDIGLYPIGTAPGDVDIYVYGPDQTPISNASVYLRQADYLQPSLMPTSSNGNNYVFSSADLALNRTYSIMVEPLTVDGQELGMYTGDSFTVGADTLTRVVNMLVVTDESGSVI